MAKHIKLELNSFLTDEVQKYNDFVLSKECNKKPNDEVLRVYIIKNNVIPHKCKICKMDPIWNKKPLDFILDRKNNNILDNDIENIRFLCPNCYSQIKQKKTIFKKNMKSEGLFCSGCKKRIKYKTNNYKNVKCFEELCKQCKEQEKLMSMLKKSTSTEKKTEII